MSKRHEVEGRIEALNDIHAIMESMKNLALMEVRKLGRYHDMQQRVVRSIAHAFSDVRCHYLEESPAEDAPPLYLLFGSERGFCGAYNEQLLEKLAHQPAYQEAPLIGVGARLAGPMQRDYLRAICLPGAAAADEVAAVLTTVVSTLNRLRRERGPLRLVVIHFQPDDYEPHCQSALPELEQLPGPDLAPVINLPPAQLLGELIEHYLFAITHFWLFAALMAENQRRIRHLEQAGHHLERQLEELGKRRNVLRQEEIIEEIEVILLSSEAVGAPGGY